MTDLIPREKAIAIALSEGDKSGEVIGPCSRIASALRSLPGAGEWQSMDTAPRNGKPILVYFARDGLGVQQVFWSSPHEDEVTLENGIWCVDDNKHGPYALRGYCDGDDKCWQPLPLPPQKEER